MPDNYYRPTLINVAGFDPLAWRVTFTGGENVILTQDMTTRTILISATLMTGSGTSSTSTVDSWAPDRPLIAMSRLGRTNARHTPNAAEATFTYVGFWPTGVVWQFVEAQVITTATNNNVAEIGLFSSPAPPNKTAQILSSLIVSTQPTGLANPGAVARNFVAFGFTLSVDTFLWCGFRQNNPATDVGLQGLFGDTKQGHILNVLSAPALTATNSWVTTISGTGEPQGVDLRATQV